MTKLRAPDHVPAEPVCASVSAQTPRPLWSSHPPALQHKQPIIKGSAKGRRTAVPQGARAAAAGYHIRFSNTCTCARVFRTLGSAGADCDTAWQRCQQQRARRHTMRKHMIGGEAPPAPPPGAAFSKSPRPQTGKHPRAPLVSCSPARNTFATDRVGRGAGRRNRKSGVKGEGLRSSDDVYRRRLPNDPSLELPPRSWFPPGSALCPVLRVP